MKKVLAIVALAVALVAGMAVAAHLVSGNPAVACQGCN